MSKERYIILLKETGMFGQNSPMGYWDGKVYLNGDIPFVGAIEDKNDPRIKIYSIRKHAENAARKLPLQADAVVSAEVEIK